MDLNWELFVICVVSVSVLVSSKVGSVVRCTSEQKVCHRDSKCFHVSINTFVAVLCAGDFGRL